MDHPPTTTGTDLTEPTDLPEAAECAQRELAERHLADFVQQAWHVIEPGKVLKWNWHHDVICEHLEAVVAGDIRDLAITVPPRHTKSTITSICLLPWIWARAPHVQAIYASYAASLAETHSVKTRRILVSPWYQRCWGHMFQLRDDQNQKRRFENTEAGHRIATSVGGSATGEDGDLIIVDDPHNVKDHSSLLKLETARDWWDHVMSSRRNDPHNSGRIVIMQRIHEGDLAGHVTKDGQYTHLNLPSIAEKNITVSYPVSGKTHERTEGDLLWSDHYTADVIKQAKKDLGSWQFSAQHQQRPTPMGGGIFKRKWWRTYRELPKDLKRPYQSWDTGFKDGQENDYSVCVTMAENSTGYYVLNVWRGRVEYPELMKTAKAQYARCDPKPARVLVEDKASGQSLTQSLKAETKMPILAVQVDRDKVARAHAISPTVEAGNVWLPEDAPWLADFLDEFDRFPKVVHDDQVDAFTQVLSYMLDFVKNKLAVPRIRTL